MEMKGWKWCLIILIHASLYFSALCRETGILQLSPAPTHSHWGLCVMLLLMFIAVAAGHVALKNCSSSLTEAKIQLGVPSYVYPQDQTAWGSATLWSIVAKVIYIHGQHKPLDCLCWDQRNKLIPDLTKLIWLLWLPINSWIILSWETQAALQKLLLPGFIMEENALHGSSDNNRW